MPNQAQVFIAIGVLLVGWIAANSWYASTHKCQIVAVGLEGGHPTYVSTRANHMDELRSMCRMGDGECWSRAARMIVERDGDPCPSSYR